MRGWAAISAAFGTSSLLYGPLHRKGAPELARYVCGGLLLLWVQRILYPRDHECHERLLLILAYAGLGVGVARIWPALTGGEW